MRFFGKLIEQVTIPPVAACFASLPLCLPITFRLFGELFTGLFDSNWITTAGNNHSVGGHGMSEPVQDLIDNFAFVNAFADGSFRTRGQASRYDEQYRHQNKDLQ